MKIEKRILVTLDNRVVALFKSSIAAVEDFIHDNYLDLGITYEDVSSLKYTIFYEELNNKEE